MKVVNRLRKENRVVVYKFMVLGKDVPKMDWFVNLIACLNYS